jgi:hypothetical protein
MIRISETTAIGGSPARVEGRLVRRYVEELRFLCFDLKASRAAFTACSPLLTAQISR